MQKSAQLNTLQAARALAAFAVTAFHLSFMMGEQRYGGAAVFLSQTKYGYLGVDFFFVLSGFIILFAHAGDIGKPSAWASYVRRRFVRLFPIYWLYTAVFVALLALGAGTAAKVPDTALGFLTSLTLVRFSDATPPLPVAWTLFHELAFYALFSLLILNVRLGVAAFAVVVALCLAFFHYAGETAPTPFLAYTAATNLYFLFGMGAYVLYRRGGLGVAEMLGGLVVVAVAAALLEYRAGPFVLVTGFALVVAGLAKLEAARRVTVPAFLIYAGNASYSIYLLHESLSGLLLKILIKTGGSAVLGGGPTYLLVLALTMVLGCVAYGTVEKPLLRKLQQVLERRAGVRQPAAA